MTTVVTIRDGVQFTPEAANAFTRAETQVLKELGRRIGVNSTYRSWDDQMRMFNAWQAYVNRTGPYPGHSKAVHPSESFHVSGLALDSDDWTNARITQILGQNGFIRNRLYVPNEQHHFEYIETLDQNRNQPSGGGAAVASPAQEEDDMLFLNIEGKYLVSVGVGVLKHWGPSTSQATREHVKNISRADDKWQPVTMDQFVATLAAYGCDPHIWDVRTFGKTKDFCVLNPLDGSVKQGNTWTAVNAMRAEARKAKAA